MFLTFLNLLLYGGGPDFEKTGFAFNMTNYFFVSLIIMSESKIMAVLLNGVAQLEYDRSRQLSDFQQDYLQNMDTRMDQGIEFGDELIENPDVTERVKFVAANLIHAIKGDDEAMSAAFCSYIATRMPEIKQVKYTDFNDEITIDLVFDEEYKRSIAIPVTTLNG